MSDLLLFPTRPRNPSAGALLLGTLRSPASSQLNGLQTYYRLEETSGVRFDAVNPGTGPVAQFAGATNEFLSRANEAALQPGDLELTVAGWFYFDVLGVNNGLISMFGASRGFRLDKNTANNLRFTVSSDGGAGGQVVFDTTLAVTTGVWYFIVAWHDPTLNTLNVQLNNGVAQSLAHSAGIFASTQAFEIGRSGASSASDHDGRAACVGYWKSAVGLGGVLTPAIRTSLYNNGVPKLYRQLTTAEKVGMIGYWELSEFSSGAGAVSRADSHTSGYTLTDNNTVTSAQGWGNSLGDVNTVTSAEGRVGTAAEFVIANSEQLAAPDSAELRGGDTDWEIAFWVRFAAVATNQTIFSKDNGAAAGREYRLDFLTATAKMTFIVYDGTNAIGTVTTTGTFLATTWYWVRCYHSASGDLVGIQIDNGTADEAATTGAPSSGTSTPFRLGANGSGTPQFFGGRLDEWGKFGRIRTAGEATAAYNSGNGLAYPLGGASLL